MLTRFETKGIYVTSGIQVDLNSNRLQRDSIQNLIDRHFRNDGDECKEDRVQNEYAIRNRDGRVVSIFKLDEYTKIFIITDGLHLANDPEYGRNYPMTTVMYAEEY